MERLACAKVKIQSGSVGVEMEELIYKGKMKRGTGGGDVADEMIE